jgi:hypothetical protein
MFVATTPTDWNTGGTASASTGYNVVLIYYQPEVTSTHGVLHDSIYYEVKEATEQLRPMCLPEPWHLSLPHEWSKKKAPKPRRPWIPTRPVKRFRCCEAGLGTKNFRKVA